MKPNILMFFTDQLRFDAIAAHGNKNIKTPNIDRLVNSGVTFTNTYTPSPVCVAARCSMHYGQYPTHTKCWNNGRMPTDDRKSYVQILSENGYETQGIGKCHFTPDTYAMRGFKHRLTQEETKTDPEKEDYIKFLLSKGFNNAIEPHGIRSEMYYIPQPSRLPQEVHPTQWIGDRTVDFLKNYKEDKPFYLFSSFIHPHPPFSPPTPWHTLYRAVDMPLPNVPENYEELQIGINKLQNRYKYRDRGIDINLCRMMKSFYYACVSFIDYQIGRILDTLEETGLAKNTVILFAADHGEMLGDYNSFGKRSMQNSAAKIPLIINGAGFEGGIKCETPTSLIDVAPTVLEIAEIKDYDAKFDGEKLQDILSGKSKRKGVYSYHSSVGEVNSICGKEYLSDIKEADKRNFACMNMMYAEKDSKYIYCALQDKEILFDEKNDKNETENKAKDEKYHEKLEYMRKTLIAELAKDGYNYLTDGDKFKAIIHPKMPENPDTGTLRQDFKPDWFDFSVLKGYKD